jgi:chromosome segregation ATPase
MKRTLFLGLIAAGLVAAQQPVQPSQDATIQALLNEVHALRLALEQSNRIGPAVQIAVAQMQMMDERVRNAAKQLQDIRDKIAESNSRKTSLQAGIKQMETQEGQAVDQNAKSRIEDNISSLKSALENQTAVVQQLQAKEADASSQLANEQNRWNEINDKLKTLELALAGPQQ